MTPAIADVAGHQWFARMNHLPAGYVARHGLCGQPPPELPRLDIDAEAFDRLYGFVSHPIPFRAGRRVAVRVVSQFGEESTKVLQP